MMYRAYYQLQKSVNRKSIAVGELFISDSLREAHARLDYMKDKGGFILISGAPGVGKTTLVRSFAESLDAKFFKIAYAPLSTVSVIEFYRQLSFLLAADIPHRKDLLFRTIQDTIIEMAINQKTIPVIILDDAQFLKNENFFELQLISNFNFDSLSPALFILIAQPHLLERLKRPAFESFYQRINLKINLQPFTLKETQLFISQVIQNASASASASASYTYASGPGAGAATANAPEAKNPNHQQGQHEQHEKTLPSNFNLFNPQAVELIFKRSKGMPRLITTIMEQALIYGAAHNIPVINEEVICDIEAEL
ncbi:MAG: ATP-binding protein [candidate division WOR-3 bacterium]